MGLALKLCYLFTSTAFLTLALNTSYNWSELGLIVGIVVGTLNVPLSYWRLSTQCPFWDPSNALTDDGQRKSNTLITFACGGAWIWMVVSASLAVMCKVVLSHHRGAVRSEAVNPVNHTKCLNLSTGSKLGKTLFQKYRN